MCMFIFPDKILNTRTQIRQNNDCVQSEQGSGERMPEHNLNPAYAQNATSPLKYHAYHLNALSSPSARCIPMMNPHTNMQLLVHTKVIKIIRAPGHN